MNPDPTPAMQISLENFCRIGWHNDCPGQKIAPPLKRISGEKALDDGSVIPLWECTKCGKRVYAGAAKSCAIVQVEAGDPTPAAISSPITDALMKLTRDTCEDVWQAGRLNEAC